MEPVRILVKLKKEKDGNTLRLTGKEGFEFAMTAIVPPFAGIKDGGPNCLTMKIDKRGFVRLTARENAEGKVFVRAENCPKGTIVYFDLHFDSPGEIEAVIDPLKIIRNYL